MESEPFIELQEAYGVLSDPERRAQYDRKTGRTDYRRRPWGTVPEPLILTQPVKGTWDWTSGAASPEPVFLRDAFERFHPSLDEIFDRLWSNFTASNRPKAERMESLKVDIRITPDQARFGGGVEILIPALATCRSCGGGGEVGTHECWSCRGQGAVNLKYPVEVRFPAGVRDAYIARIPLHQLGIDNFYFSVRFRVSKSGE